MKIKWNERTLTWFHSAAEYTNYHKEMADLILSHTNSGGTLCDIGCGAGLTDLELAPHFNEITCVDVAKEAVDSINADAKRLGFEHVKGICADGAALAGKWDTVMTLFHGGSDIFQKYFKYAADRLLIVTHDSKSERFGQKDNHYNRFYNVSGTKEMLDELGVNYELVEGGFEYGQPFTDLDDARDFFRAYVKFDSQEELDDYLREHLVETGHEKYPYYQPKMRRFGLFVIRRDLNERFA